MSLLYEMIARNLLSIPGYLRGGIHYLTRGGSYAYGVESDTSDVDLYGYAILPKKMYIPYFFQKRVFGFDRVEKFEQFSKGHIPHPFERGVEVDVTIYNIAKFFRLATDCNPTIIDILFAPQDCIEIMSTIGEYVRSERRIFLTKKCYYTFKGYAFSQLNKAKFKVIKQWVDSAKKAGIDPVNPPTPFELKKMDIETNLKQHLIALRERMGPVGSKRIKTVMEKGWDTKFGYHLVRLILEAEQILSEKDLNLRANSKLLKEIRGGAWALSDVEKFFSEKEKRLEELYKTSSLPYGPDEDAIREVLWSAITMHYREMTDLLKDIDLIEKLESAIKEINEVISKLQEQKEVRNG